MSLRSLCLPPGIRLPVRLGPTVAAIVVFACASPDPAARAQDLFGIFGNGGSDPFGAPQQQQGPAPSTDVSNDRPRHRKHKKHASDEEESGSGYTSICVRTCDGYSFPIGSYRGESDRPAHEAACRAQCPGAKTTLYVRSGNSDEIDGAIRADTRQSYTALPAAFKFRQAYSNSCTCHLPGTPVRMSFARDFTLRRGDVVMTEAGLRVFHGGTGFPFRPNAFSPLLQSHDVARKDLATFQAMDRARLRADSSRELTVTRAPSAAPKVSTNR